MAQNNSDLLSMQRQRLQTIINRLDASQKTLLKNILDFALTKNPGYTLKGITDSIQYSETYHGRSSDADVREGDDFFSSIPSTNH